MDKRTLNKYIPPLIVKHKGQTLKAIHHFFLECINVTESAEAAKVSRQCASRPIQRTKRELLKAGFRKKEVWVGRDEEIIVQKRKT